MNLIEAATYYINLPLREDAGPNNDHAGIITAMLKSVDTAPGNSWCAAFVSQCQRDSGAVNGFYSAGSQAFKAWAKEKGILFTDPDHLLKCKGALGGWTDPGGQHGHIFIIDARYTAANGTLEYIGTLEGNTNVNGSSNGDGAYARHRQLNAEYWFIDMTGICDYWN